MHGFECELSWEPEYNISQDLKNEFHRLRGQNYMIMNGPPLEKADRIMPLRRCKSTTHALACQPPIALVALASPPLVTPVDLASPLQVAPVALVQSNVVLPTSLANTCNTLIPPISSHNEPTRRRLFSTCTNTQPESYNSMPVLILPPPIPSFPSDITDTLVHISSPNCTLTKNDTILEMLQLRQQKPTVTQYLSDDDSTTEDYMSVYNCGPTDDDKYVHQCDIGHVLDSPLQTRNLRNDDDAEIWKSYDEYVPNSPCADNNLLNRPPPMQCPLIEPLGAIWTAPNCSYDDLCAIYCNKQEDESVEEHKSRVYLNLLMHMQ
jgi:hypothetical protein